jgi:hypothetical protein
MPSFRLLLWLGAAVGVALLSVAAYRMLNEPTGAKDGIFQNPELLAIVIGAVVSVVFLQQINFLRSEVSTIRNQQVESIKNMQESVDRYVEKRIERTVGVAQDLDARVRSLREENPWIETVTKRDIIAETDSARGVLRTAYMLFSQRQIATLYEFLEHNLRKGGPADKRDPRSPLRGSPDDFLDLCEFCEIYLQDSYLGTEFIHHYMRFGGAALAIQPEYVTRLLRVGRVGDAAHVSRRLERLVSHHPLISLVRSIFNMRQPMSELLEWKIKNMLALQYAYEGRRKRALTMLRSAENSEQARKSKRAQALASAEVQAELGEEEAVRRNLSDAEDEGDQLLSVLYQICIILTKIGDFDRAAALKDKLEKVTIDGGDSEQLDSRDMSMGPPVIPPLPPKKAQEAQSDVQRSEDVSRDRGEPDVGPAV